MLTIRYVWRTKSRSKHKERRCNRSGSQPLVFFFFRRLMSEKRTVIKMIKRKYICRLAKRIEKTITHSIREWFVGPVISLSGWIWNISFQAHHSSYCWSSGQLHPIRKDHFNSKNVHIPLSIWLREKSSFSSMTFKTLDYYKS